MSTSPVSLATRKPDNISESEWSSRVECAAGHHLLELYRLTDMVEGVLGLRVADDPRAYLLKPYRSFFDEVCASDLIKVGFTFRTCLDFHGRAAMIEELLLLRLCAACHRSQLPRTYPSPKIKGMGAINRPIPSRAGILRDRPP